MAIIAKFENYSSAHKTHCFLFERPQELWLPALVAYYGASNDVTIKLGLMNEVLCALKFSRSVMASARRIAICTAVNYTFLYEIWHFVARELHVEANTGSGGRDECQLVAE